MCEIDTVEKQFCTTDYIKANSIFVVTITLQQSVISPVCLP